MFKIQFESLNITIECVAYCLQSVDIQHRACSYWFSGKTERWFLCVSVVSSHSSRHNTKTGWWIRIAHLINNLCLQFRVKTKLWNVWRGPRKRLGNPTLWLYRWHVPGRMTEGGGGWQGGRWQLSKTTVTVQTTLYTGEHIIKRRTESNNRKWLRHTVSL